MAAILIQISLKFGQHQEAEGGSDNGYWVNADQETSHYLNNMTKVSFHKMPLRDLLWNFSQMNVNGPYW